MKPLGPEGQFEVAQKTREMIALVQRFLVGGASRQELASWARRSELDAALMDNAAAAGLLRCLASLELTHGEAKEKLVRSIDLAQHLRAVLLGEPRFDERQVASLLQPVAAVAARTGNSVTRLVVDGLGWFECVRFASPATGRAFLAGGPLRHDQPAHASVHAVVFPDAPDAQALLVADVLDTLQIDLDDTVSVCATPPRRWELMRADDNGNHAVVARFSGYAKARAQLAEYEARQHKQTYWLEAR
jgi:hypothetical protein